jgi:hypothetical protein
MTNRGQVPGGKVAGKNSGTAVPGFKIGILARTRDEFTYEENRQASLD